MFAAASFLLLAVPREKNNEKTLCQSRKKIADVKTEMGSTHLYCVTQRLKAMHYGVQVTETCKQNDGEESTAPWSMLL